MKKPFEPILLPFDIDDKDVIALLKKESTVRTKLERLNTMLERSVIKEELLMFFSMDESIQSTKIEGTQATFSSLMEAESIGKETEDTQEVRNYYNALQEGIRLLKEIPISTRMILTLHEIILKESRGRHRNPGQFRQIQNFIGPTNNIEDASYIPPEPQLISNYISNLEKYINDEFDDDLGFISRAAIIHAQFETIHPFLDGNGRVGRILIIIYLLSKGIISSPTFFVSEEIEKNKYKYYSLLNSLRTDEPKWIEWIKFFIESADRQSDKYIKKLNEIEMLHSNLIEFAIENKIKRDIIEVIFKKPIFTIKDILNDIDISYNTVSSYLKKLEKNGKLYGDDKKRNRTYYIYDLLDILNN